MECMGAWTAWGACRSSLSPGTHTYSHLCVLCLKQLQPLLRVHVHQGRLQLTHAQCQSITGQHQLLPLRLAILYYLEG